MRSFLAVFGREIAERRLLFWIGLAGLVPFLLPLVVANGGADLKGASAFVLAGVVCGVLSLGLGASVVARDLAERRLGFYFARPLSAWSTWAGKLGAALALALSAGLLVLLPVLLFDGTARGVLANGGWGQVAGAAGLAVLLVLFADVVSLMVRTRSAWLVFDFVAAGAVGLLGWDAALRLLRAGLVGVITDQRPETLLVHALWASAPFALVALLAGSAAQVVVGRTDPRRGHRQLSTVLWGLLFAVALGLVGYSRWLVAATPADLAGIDYAYPDPTGGAVLLQGRAAHRDGYRPLFLVDPASGRFHRLFSNRFWQGTMLVSADRRWAVWSEPQDLSGKLPAAIVRLDLTRPEARPVATRLTRSGNFASTALSPDGERLATIRQGRLLVEEMETGRLLASFALKAGNHWRSRLLFLSPSRLRFFQTTTDPDAPGATTRVETTDFDLATGKGVEVGATAPFEDSANFEPSLDGSHLIVHRPLEVLDLFAARGGAPLVELKAPSFGSSFLSDGRVLVVSPEKASGKELVLLSAEGAVLRRFSFPGVHWLRLGSEAIPGQLVVAVSAAGTPGGWESRLLDLATGESRSLGPGLPVGGPEVAAGSAGSRLLARDHERLVLLDPASGRESPLAGRSRGR